MERGPAGQPHPGLRCRARVRGREGRIPGSQPALRTGPGSSIPSRMCAADITWWPARSRFAAPRSARGGCRRRVLRPIGSGADRSGRRIFEQGILPDGRPLRAVRPEGLFSRASTPHAPSAIGAAEWGRSRGRWTAPFWCRRSSGGCSSRPPSFTGPTTTPLTAGSRTTPGRGRLTAPAYDEKKLARALREGVDPDGHPLAPRCPAMRSMTVPSPRWRPTCGRCVRRPPRVWKPTRCMSQPSSRRMPRRARRRRCWVS